MVKGVEKGVEVRAIHGSCPRPAARAATGIVPPTTAGTAAAQATVWPAQDRPEEAGSGMSGRSALVLTASDRSAAGEREDLRRRRRGRLEELGFAVERELVSDDRPAIEGALKAAPRTIHSSSRPAGPA